MKTDKPASLFFKGFAMGMADIVPGVSGGTIALITGIYDRLVDSLSKVSHRVKDIDFDLFVPLGIGVLLAIFLMSSVIDFALTEHSSPTYAFFFALILASSLLLYKDIKKIKDDQDLKFDIQVDGGINDQNAKILKEAGADVLVSGSYLFKQKDMKEAIEKLRA